MDREKVEIASGRTEHNELTPKIITTLKEKAAEASEKCLVLRRTDGAGKLVAPNSLSQHRVSEFKSTDMAGNISESSSTSDINSLLDDATSIASRLSQIVVEQEDKEKHTTLSTDCPERLKRSKSFGVLEAALSVSNSNLHTQRESNSSSGSSFDLLPEIHVTSDDGVEKRAKQPKANEADVPDSNDENDYAKEPSLRRNNYSGHLPERGDIRALEATRNRSNTINNDSMLNIKRSAWKLSEFDDTFNKNGSESNAGEFNNTDPLSTSEPKIYTPERVNSGSLLIRASKNVLSMNQQQYQQQQQQKSLNQSESKKNSMIVATEGGLFGFGDSNNRLSAKDDRRPSVSLSIVSMASSADSFWRSSIRKRDRYKRKHNNDQPCWRSCLSMSTLSQYVPILDWLPKYRTSNFWGDLTAGLAVAVLNVSTSLSAALVAQSDLGAAFKSSIVSTLIYAILCTSKHASFGSWSIMSQMLVLSVRKALSDELILSHINLGPSATWEPEEYEMWHMNIIIMYTFLIGLTQLIGGVLNMGNLLASFIPEALCSSMVAASAFTMAIGQLANMCGTSNKILWSIERNTTELWADLRESPVAITDLFGGLFRWIQQIALLVKYYDQINTTCVIISVTSVTLLFFNQYVVQVQLKKAFKKNIFIPFELILLLIMIVISYALNLSENYNVATCGPISLEFKIPNVPNLRLVRELWFDSLATALISFTMVYIMARTYSNKLNYEIDCNQELIACGAGNLVGSLFEALPATASFSRTAGQVEAGGKTQMASIINCVVLIMMVQVFGQFVAVLPICVMSATLFYGFVRMMTRIPEVLKYWRLCKVDSAIWIVTFVAILTVDLVNGFIYGLIFSILTMLYRAQSRRCYMLGSISSSDVYVPLAKYPLAREIEGIKIFQFCGPIHYVCADLFERLLQKKTGVNVKRVIQEISDNEVKKFNPIDMHLPNHIILDFSMIPYIDSAGINVIKKIIEDYQRINITILFASLASHVAAVVKKEPSLWEPYKESFYITLADAVHYAMRDSQKSASIIC